jgi:hypothetical protein
MPDGERHSWGRQANEKGLDGGHANGDHNFFPPTVCWGIQENTSPSKRRSLMALSKYVFQEQGIREYRKSETCEASNSRMCRVRGF